MKDILLTHANLVTPTGIIQDGALLLTKGKIAYAGPLHGLTPAQQNGAQQDVRGAWALPAFVDLHIHGFGGFGPELGTPEALLHMSDALAAQGVGAFCPTLYCARPEQTEHLLRALAPAVGKETGARILGFHLEGPFISPEKPGVMKPQDICAPDLNVLQRFWEAAQGRIAAMTLAPELANIAPIIAFCKAHRILMQAGHTNATYTQMAQGAAAGIKHVTHLFNAMRPIHHREPAAAGYVLMHKDVSCEVIADGFHVRPEIVTWLKDIKPIDKIIAVTDALLPTGKTCPPFVANGEEVILENGVWKRKSDRVIAGSALTMLTAFKNLVSWGYSLEQAVRCTATNPAALLGVQNSFGQLVPGAEARVVLLTPALELQEVIF